MNATVKRLSGVLRLMPTVVQRVETLHGPGSGGRAWTSAFEISRDALGAKADAGVRDRLMYECGLGMIVSGVWLCLRASVWAKAKD